MNAITIIGIVIFIVYLIYRLLFIRTKPFVLNTEIGIKSKQIYSNPDDFQLYLKRGLAFLRRGTNYAIKYQDEDALKYIRLAEEDFDKAIKLNAKCAEAYYYKGMILFAAGKVVDSRYTLAEAEKLGYGKATEFMVANDMK